MNAKEHFDEGYLHVRKMMVRGVLDLESVRAWIRQIGIRTECRTIREEEEAMAKKWGSNVDRGSTQEILLFGKHGVKDDD